MKPYKVAVVIGRFQIFHNGHLDLIKEAYDIANSVIVVIGSSHIARNSKNPFTYEERIDVICRATSGVFNGTFNLSFIDAIDNLYSDKEWATSIVSRISTDPNNVVLVGHNKDDSSYYLKLFPMWRYREISLKQRLDAASLRNHYFSDKPNWVYLKNKTPNATYEFLESFSKSEDFINLVNEREFLEKYKSQFASLVYPPIFNTVDAVVLCGTNVLMVVRGANPGKGTLALPGGFLNVNERIIDGIIRELQEETVISVSEDELRSSLKKIDYFDAPNRSLRGRTISFGGLINLERTSLPRVKGSDDAVKAFWIDINELRQQPEKIFEDHLSLINRMIGYCR